MHSTPTPQAHIHDMIDRGQIAEAIQALQKLVDEHPTDDNLHYQLGNAFRRQGHWPQALYHYATATELNPQSPAAHARQMLQHILDYRCTELMNF